MRNFLIGVLLLVAGVAFANPFVGDWRVTTLVNADHYNLTFTADGELLDTTPPLSSLGPYVYDDILLTFDNTRWLYNFVDNDNFLLFRWGKDHAPVFLQFTRKELHTEDHT